MEEIQERNEWFQTPSLEEKFYKLPKVLDMLTKEEIEGFFMECKNKDLIQFLYFSSLLDWKVKSKWKTKFLVYLFLKNPEMIGFLLFS